MSQRLDTLCADLSLSTVAKHYANLADETAKNERSYTDYLEQVLDAEHALRAARSREMLIKLATFPGGQDHRGV